jgi:ABC-type transporter Mla subunit MlaD
MPSIQDVADQINAKLDSINNNTAATVTVLNNVRGDIAQTNAKLDTLDNHLQTGIVQLANGLFAIFELLKVTNSILNHHSDQNNTIICELKNANDLLCGITRKFTRQLKLTEQLVESLDRVEGIAERAQPGPAGDYDRNVELQDRIEKCCPPEEPKPEPCPATCRVPDPTPYRPQGQDWRPPQPREPIG